MKLKAIALSILLLGSVPALADNMPTGAHVSTTGTATIEAVPDMATITVDVSVTDKEAVQAKAQVDKRIAQYFSFLDEQGIARKDIKAANVRTQPEYDYTDGKANLKGYKAVREIIITLRNLDKLNDLLDGALKAGLNEIRTVELGVSDPQTYQQQVRQKAIENAIAQADALAKGFHSTLGPVYSIDYHAENRFTPVPLQAATMRAMAAKDSAADTYKQQNITFSDRVDVVFELQRGQ